MPLQIPQPIHERKVRALKSVMSAVPVHLTQKRSGQKVRQRRGELCKNELNSRLFRLCSSHSRDSIRAAVECRPPRRFVSLALALAAIIASSSVPLNGAITHCCIHSTPLQGKGRNTCAWKIRIITHEQLLTMSRRR